MKPIRTACAQCRGTDTQYECERGQCYAEYMREQEEQWQRDEQARYDADMERRYREEPPE